MLEKLYLLAPQQTFLVSGDSAVYDALLQEAKQFPLVYTKAPQLTIEEAKNIVNFATTGGFEKTIGIFYFASYSNGAAEVLLKALEEPHENALIIIVTPHPYTFPQTLRSRMRVIPRENSDAMSLDKKGLLKMGQELVASTDDAADRREALLSFVDTVEVYAQKENDITLAQSIFDAKKFILKANLPPKQVLEYLLVVMV